MYVTKKRKERIEIAFQLTYLSANSDGVLLYLLRVRIAQQPGFEEVETVQMAAIDHGRLGYCDGKRPTDQ